MKNKENYGEISIIILATLVLTISYNFFKIASLSNFLMIFGGFLLIIVTNVVTKKIVAYRLEADVTTKFWSVYQFGFQERNHFKKPLLMVWFPLILSLITKGVFVWLPILEFEISPRIERVAKRHELYRFTQITDWHMSLIVFAGVISNIILYMILTYLNFPKIAILSLYYALWSIIPLGVLDGSKLLFGNRKLWLIATVTILITIIFQSSIF